MTSERKIRANRENARASTGPKTVQGRARAAQNHFRHGLSIPVHSDPACSEEAQALARAIAGANANDDTQDLARQVAEAHIDLRRIRRARHQLLSHTLSDPNYDSRANIRDKLTLLDALLRERQPDGALDALELMVRVATLALEGPQKFATILAQEATQLLAMDRYERRALSRRNSAVRAFDEARRRCELLRESSL